MHCDVSVSLALTGLSYQQQRHSPTAASESSTDGRPRSSESLPELGGGRYRWTVGSLSALGLTGRSLPASVAQCLK
ncbi:hypothetical protein PFLUV_G00065190 [Perca fluviatilis]|uniref:Uncharacterized protein n=1 Tax=Perca fluviatilis TaxID=8168 RepID=A0A6A5FFK4_PERFL|nr:hypothetical protein PFLUV_G00065190 [Perca fluviatilis]